MTSVLRIFLTTVFVGFATGQFLFDEVCPDYDVKQNFDVEAYLGVWYEIERYEQPFSTNADCSTATYGERDATSVTVLNRAIFLANGTGTMVTGVGELAYPEMDPLPGRLNVSFFGPPVENNYQILDTDYTRFAIVYNCVNQPNDMSYQAYWLLSRTPQLTTNEVAVATIDCLKRKYIDPSQVRTTDQSIEACTRDVEYVDLSKFFIDRPRGSFRRPEYSGEGSINN